MYCTSSPYFLPSSYKPFYCIIILFHNRICIVYYISRTLLYMVHDDHFLNIVISITTKYFISLSDFVQAFIWVNVKRTTTNLRKKSIICFVPGTYLKITLNELNCSKVVVQRNRKLWIQPYCYCTIG